MVTAGIIAEYNPFHNGHKYHIEETRRAGATHIAVVMSGTAVQRGDVAVMSKYLRAKQAVKYGADLVIELPAPYSCSGGEIFASAAVKLLAGLGEGVVNMLSFGCECSDITRLEAAADISDSLASSDEVKRLVSSGMSYPAAVAAAAGHEAGDVFSSPNNVLAVEYIKSIKKYAPWISPCAICRKGAQHDSFEHVKGFASATYIRDLIFKGEDHSSFVPEAVEFDPSFLEYAEKVIMYSVMTADKDVLLRTPDISENLANRFIKARNGCRSAAEFLAALKSKNVTLARIRRALICLVLGIKKEDLQPPPYGRILAFNRRGQEILALSKNRTVAYGTSLKRLEELSVFAARISEIERRAVVLRDMCVNKKPNFTNEYTVKIKLTQ